MELCGQIIDLKFEGRYTHLAVKGVKKCKEIGFDETILYVNYRRNGGYINEGKYLMRAWVQQYKGLTQEEGTEICFTVTATILILL